MNRMIALLFCLALFVAIGCKEKTAAPAPASPAGGAPSSSADPH